MWVKDAPARSRLVARECLAWWGTHRPMSRVSEKMAEHYVHLTQTDLEDVLQHVWVAGPGAARPGELISGPAAPLPAEQAQAVQPQVEHLAAAPPGDDDRLPRVAQAPVARVVGAGQPPQVGVVGQGAGHAVGKRVAGAADDRPRLGHGDDEAPVQAEPLGLAGFERLAEQPPGAVEHRLAGAGGHDRRLAVTPPESQRRQAASFPLALVGCELVHVLRRQHGRVVPAAGGADFQERAQLEHGPPHVIERAGAARAAGRPQHPGEVVPGQVAQPPLGHPGQVDPARAAGQPPAEVLSEEVSLLARLLRCHV